MRIVGKLDERARRPRGELNVRYVGTRGEGPATLDEALVNGIAGDGGLYMPESLPSFTAADFDGVASISDVAHIMLEPFFAGSSLVAELDRILAETFSFPIPVTPLGAHGNVSLLELYHGPTAAFKDVGAGFLAACLTRLEGDVEAPF